MSEMNPSSGCGLAHEVSQQIRVANLCVRFGELQVVDNIDFCIRPGEFVSFLGPSGCGKSTLLRVIAGLIKPTSGTVEVSSHEAGRQEAGLRLSLVFQKPLLLPWRTTLENVLLPLEVCRNAEALTVAEIEQAKRMIELVQLTDFQDAYPFQLSGGMQQRAALARALISNPDVLLMDEPFGALDEITRDTLNEEVLRIWRSAETRLRTIVMVTHSIPEAVSMSDRVFVFAPRPARLLGITELPFSYPRRLEDPRLVDVIYRLRQQILKSA